MELTAEQKQRLFQDGFVKLPGIVRREKVDAALRAVNASLGSRGIHPDDLPAFRSQSYTPELRQSPAITDLLNDTPVWEAAESAIGRGKIRPVSSGQIALRFPTMEEPAAARPHLDGMHSPNNGVAEGTIANFTALVGVVLSDLPGPFA